jgi:tRNA threonylcarbamoyladenosine biosynthesis protein TsaB
VRVLAIDTATSTASVAVVEDGAVLAAEDVVTAPGAASEALMPLVARVLERAGVAPRALDAVAVGAGPGSFTGLRIGMATAKGIAFAAGLPLWAVSSLAALALGAVRRGATGVIVPALDARRGEIYAGFYASDLTALAPERVLPPAALVTELTNLTMVHGTIVRLVGDAADVYRTELGGIGAEMAEPRTPGAVEVALLALAGARVDVLGSGAPTYIRPSEAEVMYPDGVPGALRKRP